jgi:predicted DCC family thiol-disulfide oxidoreductase YuxK
VSLVARLKTLGFVNYFADATRVSPVNLAVARVILGGYLFWKTMWYDWHLIVNTPFRVTESYLWAIPPAPVLVVEKYLLLGMLLLFVVGYRVGLTSFLSAAIISHLALVRYSLYLGGNTTSLFLGAYVLIFYGLYRDQDVLTVDTIRRTGTMRIDELRDHFDGSPRRSFRADPLRLLLLVLGIVYFGSGLDKVLVGGAAWFGPANLTRTVVSWASFEGIGLGLGVLLVEYPILATIASIGTIVLEMGLLVAILLGVPLTLPVLALLGFMTSIPLTLGILFVDVFFLVGMLFTWDRLNAALSPDRDIDLVYDDACYFCMRSLYLFRVLDTDERVRFYAQTEAPTAYAELPDVDFDRSMYVFHDDHAYEGYWAFRELVGQFGLLRPVAWLMGRRPVSMVGERVYRYVANNRSRHFTCAVDLEGQENTEAAPKQA